MKKSSKKDTEKTGESEKFPLPVYSEDEDIYSREEKSQFDEEGITNSGNSKTKDKKEEIDLDVPGSELDDDQEAIGEEDEENNYYSLGGEDHNDLEEDKEEDR